MGYITKYGSFWGMIPQTSGRIFWVAPTDSYTVEGQTYAAGDNNDRLSPERALRTVDFAIGQTTANIGDVIVMLPGAHSVSATVAVDVAGITITGIPGGVPESRLRSNAGASRARTTITSTETAGMIFTVTVADIEIAYIHFIPITAGAGISSSNASDFMYVHDCTFNLGSTTQTATFGITFPLGTGTATQNDGSIIRNCYFLALANVGPAVRAAGTVRGLTIEQSTFELRGDAAWDDAIESTIAGSLGFLIRDCDFNEPTSATTVITNGIDTTGMTIDGSTHVYRCYFTGDGKVGVNSSATPDILTSNSWVAGTTAGRTNINATS